MTPMRGVAAAILGVTMISTGPLAQPTSAPAAWVVLVDDLHFNFRNTGRLRDLVRKVFSQVVGPDDFVALRTSGPSAIEGDLGSREFHQSAVSRVTGHGLREEDLLGKDPASVTETQSRFTRAMKAAATALATFDSAGAAPRGLILISNGYARDVLATYEGQMLLDRALRQSVKIFAISGRFIELLERPAVDENEWAAHLVAERNSLRDLAERTGGFAIFTAQELPAALQRIRIE
jgi:hypothetical protein